MYKVLNQLLDTSIIIIDMITNPSFPILARITLSCNGTKMHIVLC